MSQPFHMSIAETIASTAIGFVVSLLAQIAVYPIFNLHPTFGDNLIITAIFTMVSLVRGLAVRRFFNYLHVRFA